jgi:rubrerythrin
MQKPCLNDNCYNITKQLAKKLEFLSHVSKYVEDAQKNGDEKAKTTWQTIRSDEEKHANMLRDLLIAEMKDNKL